MPSIPFQGLLGGSAFGKHRRSFLKRLARRHGWTASDTSARLVEEGLRRAEFAHIDFRDSAAGRQAYVQGSSLAVWEVALLLESYKRDAEAVAQHLGWPAAKVSAAANYAEAFPAEIAEALADNEAMDFAALKRMLPPDGRLRPSSRPSPTRLCTTRHCATRPCACPSERGGRVLA